MNVHPHRYARRLALPALVALVALAALMAVVVAPVAADPPTTSLTAAAQKSPVKWNTVLILNGMLVEDVDPPLALDGQQIEVQRATSASGPWKLVTIVTNTPGPYYSGAYVYNEKATRTYFWRMVFAGTTEYRPATSNAVRIGVAPVLGKPAVPAKAKARRAFTVRGSLKPRFKAGSRSVKLRWQIRKNGAWRNFRTSWAKVSKAGSYSKYTARVAVPRAGKFRFYALTPASAKFVVGRSPFSRTVTVR